MEERGNRISLSSFALGLGILSALLVPLALYLNIVYAPPDSVLAYSQKIFYLHLPIAIASYLALFFAMLLAVQALFSGKPVYDHLAEGAAEVSFLMLTAVLGTGMIWAKYAWGAPWTWEPRLTSSLFLWLLIGGYFLIRPALDNPDLRMRVSSVWLIICFLQIFVIHFSVRLWKGIHPNVIRGTIINIDDPRMMHALWMSLVSFLIFAVFLLLLRLSVAGVESRLNSIEEVE
ncbi:MAG: cytochrome c biogenesis protein [bacterium JZ-2024 1]